MKLEDLRRDDIGSWAAFVRQGPVTQLTRLPFTFHDYCIKSFYLTCDSIEQLEKSKQLINQGNNTVLAVGMWFISIESYVNTLLRIACRVKSQDFQVIKKQEIGKRVASLLELLQVPKDEFLKSGILQKLHEFKTFRNEIFHDRTEEGELTFHKTNFCPVPYFSNQVDAMQATIIAIEIFQAFRFVYEGFDLMPDILVKKEDSWGHVKLDILYATILRPFFVAVLCKHNLTTGLELEPTFIALARSAIISRKNMAVAVKSDQDPKFRIAPNEQETSIGADLLAKTSKTLTLDSSKEFGLPRYVLPTEEPITNSRGSISGSSHFRRSDSIARWLVYFAFATAIGLVGHFLRRLLSSIDRFQR